MDMKQLIAQIDHIENKQILNEDAHYTAAQVDNRPQVSKSNTQTSIYEMLIKEFGYDLNEAPAVPNPYQGADAAKFAAMSPADQAWLTKGGGVPDINDEFILRRAPNKGAAVVKPAAAPGGAAQPTATPGGAQPAPTVDAGATDMSMGQAGAVNAADATASATDMSMGQAGAVNAADTAAGATDMSLGQAGEVNAAASKPAVTKPPGGAAQPATNKSMTPAINAYASRMGLLKNNKPDVAAIKKFQQDNGLKADGIIGPNTAGAILSAQKPGAGGRGGPTAAQAAQATPATTKPAGGGAQPAPTGKPPRYKTPAEFDKEIARFSKSADANLPPNARYIATLQAEKAALGSGGGAQPAPTATKPALPGQISDTPAAESVKSQDDAILERIRTALFR
jgi:hypothetical protein